jgi:hypothetical protein
MDALTTAAHSASPDAEGAAPAREEAAAEHESHEPSTGERLRALAAIPVRLLGALFFPDRVVPKEVRAGRYGAPLLCIMLCGAFHAWAVSSRLDMTSVTREESGMRQGGPPPGARPQAEPMKSDREVAEEIVKARKVTTLGLYFRAIGGPPFAVLIMGIIWFLLGHFVGGKPKMARTAAAVAYAGLPSVIFLVIGGFAALVSTSVAPDQIGTLVRMPVGEGGPLERIVMFLVGVWSFWILVVGYAAAAEIPKHKAFVTICAFFALIILIVLAVVL